MFSKNSHGYRAHAHTVRVKDLLFHLYYLYVYVFGQWTVMDSSFLKSLTGTARTCGTRDKFRNFTVHYCPLSKNRIQITDTYRCFPRILTGTAHAHTVPVKKLLFYLYHLYLYGWGWVEDVPQISHAYRVRTVRVKILYFILHPHPPICRNTTVPDPAVHIN